MAIHVGGLTVGRLKEILNECDVDDDYMVVITLAPSDNPRLRSIEKVSVLHDVQKAIPDPYGELDKTEYYERGEIRLDTGWSTY